MVWRAYHRTECLTNPAGMHTHLVSAGRVQNRDPLLRDLYVKRTLGALDDKPAVLAKGIARDNSRIPPDNDRRRRCGAHRGYRPHCSCRKNNDDQNIGNAEALDIIMGLFQDIHDAPL
jgi:hypothetical protein